MSASSGYAVRVDHPPRPLRWLHLDLNSYFASVEQQVERSLRHKPVAVGPLDVDSGTIIAASYEAKAFGVRTGTKVGEARRLCPQLTMVPARHALYVDYHERIVAEVWRHVPVTHVASIDEVACRLLDNENAPETARALALRLKAGIAQVGEYLKCSIGIAPNRLLAKLASDVMKPDGLVIYQAHQLPDVLFPLPVDAISGIGTKTAARLAARGLGTIEAICANRPRDTGQAVGAVTGDRLWWLLHGHDIPERPQQSRSIGHSHVLAPQRRDAETVRLTARRLLTKAGERLRLGGYQTATLVLHARFERGQGDWSRAARLPPTQDSFALLAALDGLWPQLARELVARGVKVRTIGVSLAEVVPHDAAQGSLWGLLPEHDPLARATKRTELSHALDTINQRWGKNSATVGPLTGGRIDRAGGSIAFGRIPEKQEFTGRR